MSGPVLQIKDLKVAFGQVQPIQAVDCVTMSVASGEVLGLVGESGSGKTVTGLAIMGLIDPPGRIVDGSILVDGEELIGRPEPEMRALRGKKVAMIFQDPMTTLNPVLRIDTQIVEAICAHENLSTKAARAKALAAIRSVGIAAPEDRLRCYPHQLSGGMRQRIAIAIALLHRPAVLIADEPTTALDVTVQAQILSLVQTLANENGTAMVWITHDLAVVAGLADRLAVMYAGRVVEEGPVDSVLRRPIHPYTTGLIESVPSRNKRGAPLSQIPGMSPSLAGLPQGCSFGPRCPLVTSCCRDSKPDFVAYGNRRAARCFHPMLSTDAA